jgi:hypothetical protein
MGEENIVVSCYSSLSLVLYYIDRHHVCVSSVT